MVFFLVSLLLNSNRHSSKSERIPLFFRSENRPPEQVARPIKVRRPFCWAEHAPLRLGLRLMILLGWRSLGLRRIDGLRISDTGFGFNVNLDQIRRSIRELIDHHDSYYKYDKGFVLNTIHTK